MAIAKKKSKSTIKDKVKRIVKTRARKPRTAINPRHATLNENDRWMAFVWVLPVLAIAAGATFLLGQRVNYPVALTSAKLVSYFQKAQPQPIGDRIAFWSDSLLKHPEMLSSIGRGPVIDDTAPVFPATYDCTTFIETVGALARSENGQELADRVISIRYRDAKVSFETRNHFPEADWIPNNEAAGNLHDITTTTARKAGYVVSFVNKDINKLAWYKENGAPSRVIASAEGEKPTTVHLPYLPLDSMMKALTHVPQGAVINVVRASRERYPVLISHQGFLIWKNGVPYFRHASRSRQISEVPFSVYLETLRGMPWKVLGFNVNTFEG